MGRKCCVDAHMLVLWCHNPNVHAARGFISPSMRCPLVHKEACGTWLAASFDLQSVSWLSAACLPAELFSNCSLSLSILVQSTCNVLAALTLSARDIPAHCRAFTHPAIEYKHAHDDPGPLCAIYIQNIAALLYWKRLRHRRGCGCDYGLSACRKP